MQQLSGCSIFGFIGAVFLFLASLSTSYFAFVVSFSVGFGIASGAVYINALSVAANSSRPKLATPIMVASFGLGGAIFGPVWRLLAASNWDMSALLPVSAALLIAAVISWLHKSNSSLVVSPDKAPTDKVLSKTHSIFSKTKLLLLIWFTFGFGSMGGLMVLGLASKFIDVAGGSVLISTIAVTGVAVGNTTGRLSVGLITLRYPPINSIIAATIIIGISLVTLAFAPTGNSVAVLFAMVAIASGYGIMASAVPTLVGTIYETSVFARVYSIVFCAWGLAGLTAPWVTGVIFDQTDSFKPAVIGALLCTFIAFLTALMIKQEVVNISPAKHAQP